MPGPSGTFSLPDDCSMPPVVAGCRAVENGMWKMK